MKKFYKRLKQFVWVICTIGLVLVLTSPKLSHNESNNQQQLYTLLSKSVIKVYLPGTGGGTGFLVKTPKGNTIGITNRHVCDVADNNHLYASRDDEFKDKQISVIEKSIDHDICLIEPVPGVALEVGTSVSRFSTIYVLGHPRLYPQTPALGNFMSNSIEKFAVRPNKDNTCPEGTVESPIAFGLAQGCFAVEILSITNVPIYGGNSGSPVVDSSGKVIGIINSADDLNHGAFVPSVFINDLLKKY